jgi:hypothetical protein
MSHDATYERTRGSRTMRSEVYPFFMCWLNWTSGLALYIQAQHTGLVITFVVLNALFGGVNLLYGVITCCYSIANMNPNPDKSAGRLSDRSTDVSNFPG